MSAARNTTPETSLIMTRAEYKARLQEAFAPVRVTDYLLDAWMERGFAPCAIALGGLRSNGKACRAVWLRADVEAFLNGLASQPRLAARLTERESAVQHA